MKKMKNENHLSKKLKKELKEMKNKNYSSQFESTPWGIGKTLRYQSFKFFYFFNNSYVFAKDRKEAEEFVDRFENQNGGPQMG